MKAKKGFVKGKLVNGLIVALVLTGTALVAGIGDVSQGSAGAQCMLQNRP